jgi:uncharacterized membrane protein YhaH (DUF805 family)
MAGGLMDALWCFSQTMGIGVIVVPVLGVIETIAIGKAFGVYFCMCRILTTIFYDPCTFLSNLQVLFYRRISVP